MLYACWHAFTVIRIKRAPTIRRAHIAGLRQVHAAHPQRDVLRAPSADQLTQGAYTPGEKLEEALQRQRDGLPLAAQGLQTMLCDSHVHTRRYETVVM